jgi:hypothetical protein
VLRILLKVSDEAPHLRKDVFVHVVELFLRRNANAYQEQIEELARDHEALSEYLSKRSH